ncbi:hypothetical protein J2T19_005585 [Paenibacillus tundrae]|uniref:Uncharacterized protein n=1 Tax=Paenibacillus tundrae TaxID=528187 RepID=A0ABT9WLM8_9BACL|nr:hypothetical protein [Paenibacillus tundrae]
MVALFVVNPMERVILNQTVNRLRVETQVKPYNVRL